MKTLSKRIMALVLTLALAAAIPFAFTQEASAAAKKSGSKKVSVHLISDESLSRDVSGGLKYVTVTKNTYNRKGFKTKYVTSNNKGGLEKYKIKYNSKGYMTSCKVYNKNNKLFRLIKVKMKNGKPYTSKEYSVNGRKRTLIYKQTFVYKGKKLKKIKWRNLRINTSGTIKVKSASSAQKGSEKAKYDKYGNLISDTRTSKQTESGVEVTTTYKITHQYTYDMVGNILEDVCTETTTKVPAKGKKSEVVTKTVMKYKYKKMKVLKKYLEQIVSGGAITYH